jgi:predicted metal-binding membrane protein
MTSTALVDPPPPRASDRGFFVVLAALFAPRTAVTVAWSASMASMGGMPMPGGWTMSMAWMRMPDQAWSAAAATFLGMWIVMMAAMMLPSLAPMLSRYRRDLRAAGATRLGWATTVAGAGYSAVWAALGAAVYPLGVALAEMEMRYDPLARAVPLAGGLVVLGAGALQLTAWKARALACCRQGRPSAGAATAWRDGLRIGLYCARCSAGPMAVLLAIDVMDPRIMAVVTAAITAERLAPAGERVARVVGLVTVGFGVVLVGRALVPA